MPNYADLPVPNSAVVARKMKVLLVGGTGVFGSRLARLLVRDGHHVTIAGRNLQTARALAAELTCSALQMDRNGELTDLEAFDVLVDAAGPFHAYGDDPYRLARAALDAGLHYLDLSDNAAFCAGISALDSHARAAGRCAISGLSSVPALSSAAVKDLCGDQTPSVISSAILPGNRSPRGLSVMASILEQAGRPLRVWRGGRWQAASGWSKPEMIDLPKGLRRQAWLIEVPDLALFPAHFGAQSVMFRAGLELGIFRYGLWMFAQVRRVIPFAIHRPILRAFKFFADLLAPFGSGQGGMSVQVIVGDQQKTWRLLVEDGDGPFIPAIAVRALLRRHDLPVGAKPALEVITLAEAEAAMSDLRAQTEIHSEAWTALFPSVLGSEFDKLPEAVRDTHKTADVSVWRGMSSVTRGTDLWSRALCVVFGFPRAAQRVPVCVTKTVTASGETWVRQFGNRSFRSHLSNTEESMTERFGPFTFLLGLCVKDKALLFPVQSGRMGPVPLPRWMLPVSCAREYEDNGVFHFDVSLRAPISGKLMVRYRGWLSADEGDPEAKPEDN